MTAYLANTPVLETERLTLRAPRIEDFPVCEYFTCSDRSKYVRAEPGTPRVAWRTFAHMAGMWSLRGYGLFVFCDEKTGAALGVAGPWHPIDWPEPEIGWSVWRADAEGKGYACEAVKAARRHAFESLGWSTAVSYIDPGNSRSIALAERLGCAPDATARRPDFGTNAPLIVYRHPSAEAVA